MNREEIKNYLPHREPMLLVDDVTIEGDTAVGHYTVRGDDAMTLVLLASFVMLVVALGNSWHFIVRQAKDFFAGNSNRDDATETSGELRFQLFLAVITGLLLAIGIFLYTSEDKTAAYVFDNDMMFVGLLFAMSVGYYLMKLVLYKMSNLVLFGVKKSLQWKRAPPQRRS